MSTPYKRDFGNLIEEINVDMKELWNKYLNKIKSDPKLEAASEDHFRYHHKTIRNLFEEALEEAHKYKD